MTNPNDSAFTEKQQENFNPALKEQGYEPVPPEHFPLTKREYFAAMAMQIVERPKFYVGDKETEESLDEYSKRCVQIANALIKQLNESK